MPPGNPVLSRALTPNRAIAIACITDFAPLLADPSTSSAHQHPSTVQLFTDLAVNPNKPVRMRLGRIHSFLELVLSKRPIARHLSSHIWISLLSQYPRRRLCTSQYHHLQTPGASGPRIRGSIPHDRRLWPAPRCSYPNPSPCSWTSTLQRPAMSATSSPPLTILISSSTPGTHSPARCDDHLALGTMPHAIRNCPGVWNPPSSTSTSTLSLQSFIPPFSATPFPNVYFLTERQWVRARTHRLDPNISFPSCSTATHTPFGTHTRPTSRSSLNLPPNKQVRSSCRSAAVFPLPTRFALKRMRQTLASPLPLTTVFHFSFHPNSAAANAGTDRPFPLTLRCSPFSDDANGTVLV